jgi:hypothetical protein
MREWLFVGSLKKIVSGFPAIGNSHLGNLCFKIPEVL